MQHHAIVRPALRMLAASTMLLVAAAPVAAQDFRLGGGLALPRGNGGTVGGQAQASIEVGPQTTGFGMRVDLLYAQTAAPALSLAHAVSAGQATRTYAAAGGVFYRRDVRDFAPYVIAGAGAYGQTASPGVSLGLHGGAGVDWAGTRTRPFVEARVHRLRGDAGSVALQRRERSLISALVGVRF